MDYGDCEAEETDVTTPVIFFEFLTNEAREETNEGDCAERKKRKMDQDGDSSLVIDTSSKYTSNSGAGCSKSMAIEMGLDGEKVFKAVIHEQVQRQSRGKDKVPSPSWTIIVLQRSGTMESVKLTKK